MGASYSVKDHVQKLQELKNEISMIDIYVKDKEFITIMHNSLPDVFYNFVMPFFVSSQYEVPTLKKL